MKVRKDRPVFESAVRHLVERHLSGTLPAELEPMALRWLKEADALRLKEDKPK